MEIYLNGGIAGRSFIYINGFCCEATIVYDDQNWTETKLTVSIIHIFKFI